MADPLNIEQSLVEEGVISNSQLQTLKLEQQRSSVTLVEAIRRLKFLPEDTLVDFLCKKLHLTKFDLADYAPDKDLVSLLPMDFIWQYKVIPLFKKKDELAVGLLDPLNTSVLEELRFRTGLFIKPYLVKEDELNDALSEHFDRRKVKRDEAKPTLEATRREGAEPSVVEAINLLLLQAVKVNASDVHIEPQEGRMHIRLRVDGVLKDITPFEQNLYNAVVSRIKIMSNLDIAEKRLPQDGRFKVEMDEGSLDVRVSVMPTIQGESVVLRLLRQNKKLLTLQELGMAKENYDKYLNLIHKPSGIILVTGPTGSGKTTTLYASLTILKSSERNIITIEDPVEYQLDFCRQIQVNPKVNLLFSTGLRSILRHDPDIIMIGEIRDRETAEIAIQAALTGHLVFSTLHTNDSASAITRLIDMGIEPFLIASCLNGVVAQRLIRGLCPKCKKHMDEDALKGITLRVPKELSEKEKAGLYEAQGCQDCLYTGYSGRIGIFEIMEMAPQIGRLTVEKQSSDEIISYCRSKGMEFLYDDGWKKVLSGATSPQELLRILGT
ncbi:MAG: GspE/PulE family protein [Candidatus Omnitrophica bacterium]|nr:GspE/PulE family protein [Candidatus Omnitrophota bacterium]MDD5592936.1 GspE/PulE family protein [Candidatus Omnitrophota bacterium]